MTLWSKQYHVSCIIIKINIVRREVISVWVKTKTLACHLVLTTHAGYLPYVDPWIYESFLLIFFFWILDFYLAIGASHGINEHCSWWVLSTETRPLFHIFVWTTGRSSISGTALADTRFFDQGDSNIRGPTLYALYTQVYLDQPDTLGATCVSGISKSRVIEVLVTLAYMVLSQGFVQLRESDMQMPG